MKVKYLAILLMTLGIFVFNFCSNQENSIKIKLNEKIESNVDKNQPLQFKIIKYNSNTKHVTLQIECDFSKIDSSTYLSQLGKVENILLKEGIYDFNYQVVNRPGSSKQRIKENLYSKSYSNIDSEDYDKYDDTKTNEKTQVIDRASESYEKHENKTKKELLYNRGEINFNFVRLREKPSVTSPIVTYLFKGTVLKIKKKHKNPEIISGTKDNWYFVESKDNVKGWLFGEYLSRTKQKNISTIFQNNLIYSDFLKKKKLLVPKEYQKLLNNKQNNVKILTNKITLKIDNNKTLNIPFKLSNDNVNWKLNEIKLNTLRYKITNSNNKSPQITQIYLNNEYSDNSNFENNKNFYHKGNNKYSRNKINNNEKNYYRTFSERKIDNQYAKSQNIDSKGRILENTVNSESLAQNNFYNNKIEKTYKTTTNQNHYNIKASKDYNLSLLLDPYLKRQLSSKDSKIVDAIYKLVEAKLITHDYKKDVKFHSTFNSYYDTIEITLLNFDLDNKIAIFNVRRIEPSLQTGPREIIRDRWDIDYKIIDDYNLDYNHFDNLYYSEIILYLSRAGVKHKADIIGLSNYIVKLLINQNYVK
ncbi:MAG: SH3 domain-containing protein [Spirochaetota bacterium]|nr:SH3 domain-containing protein [Spirochaetota bacterium]